MFVTGGQLFLQQIQHTTNYLYNIYYISQNIYTIKKYTSNNTIQITYTTKITYHRNIKSQNTLQDKTYKTKNIIYLKYYIL